MKVLAEERLLDALLIHVTLIMVNGLNHEKCYNRVVEHE